MRRMMGGMVGAAGVALLAQAACAQAAGAQTAMSEAQWHARAAALRAAWAAHPAPAGTVTEPSLVAGRVATPVVNVGVAPGVPTVALTLDPGTVGISAIQIDMISPGGRKAVSVFYGLSDDLPQAARAVLPVQIVSPFAGTGFGLYSPPGAWSVAGVVLLPKDGGFIAYQGPQLSAVFPSPTVQVVNTGKPDVTPPTAGAGVILTPTVRLSSKFHAFAAALAVADNISGVQSVVLELTPPGAGAQNVFAESQLLAPVSRGNVVASLALPANAPTGTYTIAGISLCDAAENCVTVADPLAVAASFGTTTFEVTQ